MAVYNLYDRDNDKWITANDGDATSMVASGKYGLQSGITVPVTHVDGSQGDVPSDNFEAGARSGEYRFRTDADNVAFENQQQEAIANKQFDHPVQSFVEGGLRGATLGLSDPIQQVMGDIAQGGSDSTVKTALNEHEERHPVLSGAGELAGAVASIPLTGGADAIGAGAERLGARALEGLGESTAAKIVQKVGASAARESAVGAFYGLGTGVSEASLGDPNEVAQNLASSVELGSLFGGAFGSGFGALKAASPFAKAVVSKATGFADDLVSGALRKSASAALSVTLSAKGEAELGKIAGDLASNPEVRQAYFSGGAAAVKDIVKQSDALEASMSKQAATVKDKLDDALASTPKRIKDQIQSDLANSSGNLSDMLQTQLSGLESDKIKLFGAMKADQTPGTSLNDIYESTNDVIKNLEATKDPKAIAVARGLQTRLDAELSARSIGLNPHYGEEHGLELFDNQKFTGALTQGQEGIVGYELKRLASVGLENKLPIAAEDALTKYHGDISKIGKEGAFGADLSNLEDKHTVFDKAREFVTGATSPTNVNVKQGVIQSILTDPRRARDFDTLFGNLSEFMPEMDAYRAAGADAVEKMKALREANTKFQGLRNQTFDTGLSLDDIAHTFDSFGSTPQHLTDNIAKLRELQGQLNAQDAGAVSKYSRLMALAGKEVGPEIAALQKHELGFQALDKLSGGSSKAQDPMNQFLLSMGIERTAKKLVGHAVGGMLGGAAGSVIGGAIGGGLNSFNMLQQLTRLESISTGSLNAVKKSINGAVDALTSKAVQRVGTPAVVQRSVESRRKDFKERSAYLNKLSTDPNALTNEAVKRTKGLESLPQVSAAISSQFANTVSHLAQTMPKDPFAGSFLSSAHSNWKPSDMDLMAWEKRVDTAEDPKSAIQAIAKGNVSPEQIDTLQQLYPSHFDHLQQSLSNAIMDPDAKLSYQQKLTIGKVLSVQADPSLAPATVKSLQAQFAEQQAGRPETNAPKGFHPARLDLNIDAMTTDTQRLS